MFRRILGGVVSVLLLGVVACSDDNPSAQLVEPNVDESSSSVDRYEMSSSVAGTSSSRAIETSSSSAIAENSSSSADAPVDPAACLWNGKKGDFIVNTGLGLDAESGAGYWYSYDDTDEGGLSRVVWDVDCPNDGSDCMQYIVDHCGGLCGKMYVEKGTAREANVGVAFNVAGFENPGESVEVPKSADISDWGGICVTFASSLNLFLKLGIDENTEVIVELGQSDDLVEECFTWNDFDDGENPISGVEAAKKVRNIKFGKRSGESMIGTFKIVSVGKYVAGGSCKVVASNPNSSSSTPSSSDDGDCVTPESVSEMWYGPKAVDKYDYHVATGLDNGSEASGYWFSFSDENGNAHVSWPVMQLEYENVIDRVIEECKGICGMFKFINEGVTGIGFNIAGTTDGSYKNAAFGDASSWGGVCVTYTSGMDMDVAMSDDTTFFSVEKVAMMPRVLLPKSMEAKTVCAKWSDFVTPVETPGNPAHFTSLLFVAYGDAGSESDFNVIGIGKYADVQNVCKQSVYPFVPF